MSDARVALVLGAGGTTGGAFHAAVLATLAEHTGWDPRSASLIVGTSAGSVAAASLRAGLSAADMLARTEGRPPSAEGRRLIAQAGLGAAPPLLRPETGRRVRLPRPADAARSALGGLGARPAAFLASMLPPGQVSTDVITAGVDGLTGGRWPAEPLWVCAVNASNGRLAVFGKEDIPRVALGDAVAASCAIPGFFQQVSIGGVAYIDGGAHSPTNADLCADPSLDLDLVIISSPMSIAGGGLRLAADQPMRRWSRALLDGEARRLRRRGIPVVAFQPSAADAQVMGLNAMDPSRRAAVARQARASTASRLAHGPTREKLSPIWAG